ncbi:MAG: hypothetical protein RL021_2083, partial [Bacteroidota bacterium]
MLRKFRKSDKECHFNCHKQNTYTMKPSFTLVATAVSFVRRSLSPVAVQTLPTVISDRHHGALMKRPGNGLLLSAAFLMMSLVSFSESAVAQGSGCTDPVIVFVGPDVHICETGDVQLSGFIDGPVTTGHWVGGLGTYSPNDSDLNATYTPDPSEAGTTFTITLQSDDPAGDCDAVSASLMVTVDQLIDVFVGPDINICVNGSASLSGFVGGGVSTGQWDGGIGTFSPDRTDFYAEYTPDSSEAGTTVTLTLIADNGTNVCPPASAFCQVVIAALPVVEAGDDADVCYPGQIQLNGSVTAGATQGHWTGGAGTFVPDRNTLNAVYIPDASEAGQPVELYLVADMDTSSNCTSDSDMVTLNVFQSIVAAGPDIHICANGSATLGGFIDGLVTTGHWTGGTGTFVPDATDMYAEYIPDENEGGTTVNLVLELDATAGCYLVTDTIELVIDEMPIVFASGDVQTCAGGAVTLSAYVGGGASSGHWSGGAGAFSPDRSDPNAEYTPDSSESGSVVTLYYVTEQIAGSLCPSDSSPVFITVDVQSFADAGNDMLICFGASATISGSVSGYVSTGTWTTTGDGTFQDSSLLTTIYVPGPADEAAGSVELILTPDTGGICPPIPSSFILHINPELTLYSENTDASCAGSSNGAIDLVVSGGTTPYTYVWTKNGSTTTFATTQDLTGLTLGTYDVLLTDSNNCTATFSATLIETDPNNPILVGVPSNTTVSCESVPSPASVTSTDYSPSAPVPVLSEVSTQSADQALSGHYNYTITRTWTATDDCNQSTSASQVITVQDITAPTAICKNITVQLDATGNVSIVGADVNNGSTDNCSPMTFSVTPSSFTCANVGPNAVVMTATDVTGNSSACSATVTVQDQVAPVAVCKDITIQLNSSGSATILAADINNGSSDACGIASLAASKTSFDCTNVGANTVTLTVTDNNGNSSTCTSTVTVQDQVAPTAACKNITIQLNASGTATIVAADVDNGSADACGIASLSVSKTSFDCTNIGANTVTLTVTDNNGNTSTCTSTVTVQDVTAPNALCQNITVLLYSTGTASITAADINNGSNDACGIASLSASQTVFTTSDVGINTVVLTVTDNNGNTATCSSTVTVQDVAAPLPLCKDITVQLDSSGSVTIAATDIDNGSSDPGGIASYTASRTSFACVNV